jgi:hypothetical protein
MISLDTCLAILDTIPHPLLFVDNDHVIRHLNRAAEKKYYEQRGLSNLVGQSLFDCHKSASHETIRGLHARLRAGEEEIFLVVTPEKERVTMIAVRDRQRNLLGYYERFEKDGGPG